MCLKSINIIISKYDFIVGSFDKKIEVSSKVIIYLSKLHNAVLSKFMSGNVYSSYKIGEDE